MTDPSPQRPMKTPFAHAEKIETTFNAASRGRQDDPADDGAAARLAEKTKEDFAAAHEGPRETIAEPRLEKRLTPGGETEELTHTEIDQAAIASNREKDAQMRAYRGVEITKSRAFNARALAPVHLREQVTPEVLRRGRHQQEKQNDADRGR